MATPNNTWPDPPEAFYSNEMGEFFLLYENVQRSEGPEAMLLEFFAAHLQCCG